MLVSIVAHGEARYAGAEISRSLSTLDVCALISAEKPTCDDAVLFELPRRPPRSPARARGRARSFARNRRRSRDPGTVGRRRARPERFSRSSTRAATGFQRSLSMHLSPASSARAALAIVAPGAPSLSPAAVSGNTITLTWTPAASDVATSECPRGRFGERALRPGEYRHRLVADDSFRDERTGRDLLRSGAPKRERDQRAVERDCGGGGRGVYQRRHSPRPHSRGTSRARTSGCTCP